MYTDFDIGQMTGEELAFWMSRVPGPQQWEDRRDTSKFVRVATDWRVGYDTQRWILVQVAFPRVDSTRFKVTYSGQSGFVKRAYANDYIEEEVAHIFQQGMLIRAANPGLNRDYY